MSSDPQVVVALSGGVDSAVAALILAEQGYELSAVTLRLRGDQDGSAVPAPEAVERARALSDLLGIEFHLIDARAPFKRQVVDTFVREYAEGRTPNPCVPCNRLVRFRLLTDHALQQGAERLTTGHYARVRETDDGYQLLRGREPAKDQSYFLHGLSQNHLRHVLFPLGDLTKEAVRDIANRHGLAAAEQAESQDICFLAGRDYRQFLAEHAPHALEPGPILDTERQVLGQHQGLAAYTIGQRKGLGISASEPLYVLAIEPEKNALIVGTAGELEAGQCLVEAMHYISGEKPATPFRAKAEIRYRARPAPVTVEPLSRRRARVTFDEDQRGITPGQFLVLYEADVVLGGGIICEAQNYVL